MLTIKQLIRATQIHKPEIVGNARKTAVRFEEVEDIKGSDGKPYRHIIAKVRGSTIDRKVVIDLYEPWKGEDSKCWVSCDCEYWMFHSEQAVSRKDSTDIIYCDPSKRSKDPDRQINPALIPHLCKHTVGCIFKGILLLKPKTSKYFDLKTGKPK